MNKSLLPLVLTVIASVGTYYLLDAKTGFSEELSMAGGVMVAVFSAIATKKLFDRKK